MKRLLVLVVCLIVAVFTSAPSMAQISYCKDILEPGNPPDVGVCDIIGGACTTDDDCTGTLTCLKDTLKTWDETWEMPAGEMVEMDIWLNDVPTSLLTAGFYITYDTALIDITSVVPNDTNNGGQWDGSSTNSFEVEPGQWFLALVDFACIAPDGDGDIFLARVTFQCQATGDVDVTISTVPEFATVVDCATPTVYDAEIVPNIVTITQNAGAICTVPGDCADDGNLCTITDCVDETCVYNPVVCDDADLCTTDSCDPGTGECVFSPVDCDDSDVCTTDSCNPTTGECFNEPIVCDDDDLCTIDDCDPATGCYSFPVDCSDLDNQCNVGVCNPGTGLCVSDPVVDCSDGDLCTQDICNPGDGICSNPPEDCDDGVECTNDSCDPATGCLNEPDDLNCDDDIACTDDICDPLAGCQNENLCNDDNPCTDDICDPVGYCVFNAVVDGTSCDDGVFCNGFDTCIGGECQSGIPCTDDPLFCNGIETCDEVNDECIRSGDPCLPEGQCDEENDMCWSCELTISPSSLTVPTFGTRQFSASSNGNCPIQEPDPSCYTWEVAIQESTGSDISATGSYTAGGNEGTDVIQVSDTCNLNISATATAIVIPDTDEDGIRNEEDNCPEHPNGPYLGTCIRITGGFFTGFGVPCIDSTDCASDELCDTAQLDFDETGVGDACECRGNFDGDSDIDGKDAFVFKVGFGRSDFFNPCPSNQ